MVFKEKERAFMMEKKYSLWLMPGGSAREALQGTIRSLGGRFRSPLFEPHVTLLSKVTGEEAAVIEKAGALASALAPVEIRLTRADHRGEYFRCFFILVDPSPAVMGAHETAKRVFGIESGEAYLPHLSLVYGEFTPEQKAGALGTAAAFSGLAFTADKIYLYRTQGEVKDWKRVEVFGCGQG
jgi:2'-5' RNA ligase